MTFILKITSRIQHCVVFFTMEYLWNSCIFMASFQIDPGTQWKLQFQTKYSAFWKPKAKPLVFLLTKNAENQPLISQRGPGSRFGGQSRMTAAVKVVIHCAERLPAWSKPPWSWRLKVSWGQSALQTHFHKNIPPARMGAQANVYANGANMTILAETQLHQLTNQWMVFGTQKYFLPSMWLDSMEVCAPSEVSKLSFISDVVRCSTLPDWLTPLPLTLKGFSLELGGSHMGWDGFVQPMRCLNIHLFKENCS